MTGLVGGKPPGEAVEVAVVGMDQAVDVAEREILVLPPVAEQGVHRVGPVDPAPGDVPVPQAASAAAQGRLQAAADLLAGTVGPGGLPGLQAVGEADADDHEARGGDQDDLVAGAGAPAAQQRLDGLEHRHLPAAVRQAVHGGEHALAPGQVEGHGAGALAEPGKRLAVAEHLRQGRQVGGQGRMGRDDAGVGPHQQEAPAGMPLALRHQRAQVRAPPNRSERPPGRPAARSLRPRSGHRPGSRHAAPGCAARRDRPGRPGTSRGCPARR